MPIIHPALEKKLLENSHGLSPPGRDPAEVVGLTKEPWHFRTGGILQANSFHKEDGSEASEAKALTQDYLIH